MKVFCAQKGLLAPEEAKVSLFDSPLQWGMGLFETLRSEPDGRLFLAERHVARLFASAAKLDIRPGCGPDQALALLHQAAQADRGALRIKACAWEGHFWVMSQPHADIKQAYESWTLLPLQLQRNLPQHKSMSMLPALRAYQEATRMGYDEALLLNAEQYVLEASRANLFWVKWDQVFTTLNDALPGITQGFLREQGPQAVAVTRVTLAELLEAQEIFLTNAVQGVMPVSRIAGLGFEAPGPLTHAFRQAWETARREQAA